MANSQHDRWVHCKRALQEKAGLSGMEARAYLMNDWEVPESVAMDLGMSLDELYTIKNRAMAKVKTSGLSRRDLFGEMAMETVLITPSRGELRARRSDH